MQYSAWQSIEIYLTRIMPIRFDHPELLWLLLLAIPAMILAKQRAGSMATSHRRVAVGLRLLVLLALVSMLAGLQAVRWHHDLTVVAVVDLSESVRRFARPLLTTASRDTPLHEDQTVTPIEGSIAQWIEQSAAGHQPNDRLGVITYDGRPTVRKLPSTEFEIDTGSAVEPTEGSNSAAAIRLASAMFTTDHGKRMVLISDGNDTTPHHQDELLAAARQARAMGIVIDVLPMEYAVQHEVIVEGLYTPVEARQGQTITLRVVLRATAPADGQLYIKHNGRLIDLNGPSHQGTAISTGTDQWVRSTPVASAAKPTVVDRERTATGQASYVWVRRIQLPLVESGANRFEAVFEPAVSDAMADTVSANNHAEAFTLVHGKARLLFVHRREAQKTMILPGILDDHGIELELAMPDTIPWRMDQLQNYDAVILQDVPAEKLTASQQKNLARYVSDLGGGLVMIGGPNSFGAGGWTDTPIDPILPVECQIPNQTLLPSGALVLVLDRSGSMGDLAAQSPYTKQELANEAAILAMNTLYQRDMVGVVAFDQSPQWIVPLQLRSDPTTIAQQVRQIRPGGGTRIHPALDQACQALAKLNAQEAAVKHVILLTDGQSQAARYDDLIGKMADAKITVSAIGVGDQVNRSLLIRLAQATGGTYHPVSDPHDLPQIFMREARTVRRNLVKEGLFNPTLLQTASPIVGGISDPPPLEGFVLTATKRDRRVYTPMVGPEGEPIFAHWQVGLGRCAAFTSDAADRWAKRWLRWDQFADFWTRTVRGVARPAFSGDFDLLTWIDGDHMRIRLDTGSAGGNEHLHAESSGDLLRVRGTVLLPNDTTATLTLSPTGPGIYEGRVPAAMAGSYIARLFVDHHGPEMKTSFQPRLVIGGCIRQRSAELRTLHSNRARLEQIAATTGGRVLSAQQIAPLYDRDGVARSRSIRPLWPRLMHWLLVLFLVDVAVRRIPWGSVSIFRWALDRIDTVRQLSKPRHARTIATLSALKARADQVELTKPPPSAHHGFEPPTGVDSVTAVAKPQQSLPASAAVDTASGNRTPPRPVTNMDENDQPPTTRRLLDAKRRVHKRIVPDSDQRHD